MKAHILIVDDDPRITDLLRRVLAYEGYSVASAASGGEALNRSLERPPDLVVLDIMLPGLDGLEVAQRLRAAGDNVVGLVPALLYDPHGNVVGSENPQVLTSGTEEKNFGFMSCNSPEGFKEGHFSSVIELFG